MTDATMSDYMAKEKTRLEKQRTELQAQITDLEKSITGVDRQLAAIAAYQTTLVGKPTGTGPRRDTVLALLKDHKALTRAALIEHLGIQENNAHKAALSNMLTALTKAGKVTKSGKEYSLPAA